MNVGWMNLQIPSQILLLSTPSLLNKNMVKNMYTRDFPDGAVVKNPPANAGDTGSSPGPGRSHMPRSS